MIRSLKNRSDKQWSDLLWDHDIPFIQNRPVHIMISVFILVWVLMAIHPVNWKDWIAENCPMILFIGLLAFLYRHFQFSNFSYVWITVFLILHTFGAHYAYQNTPVDHWAKQIFHAERGIYDRIVHFAFGLLLTYPVQEFAVRVAKLKNIWIYVFTFTVLMAASAIYEIGEMLVALMVNEQFAEIYLGIQGDLLDTAKDMSMALLGNLATISVIIYCRSVNDNLRSS